MNKEMIFSQLYKRIQFLYGTDVERLEYQKKRYENLLDSFFKTFTDVNDLYFFSTPGRTELGGNHTDHNLGRVLAASVNLDSIAVASKNNTTQVKLVSKNFDQLFTINLTELEILESEKETTISLMKGIVRRFHQLGYNIGGFNSVINSDVLVGSGLSSSASFEVLIATILNELFNHGIIPNEELAKIGQWAENNYFGKPCGLMDQMACSVGGIIAIDFKNIENPLVERIDFNFEAQGYKMLIVDTGGHHVDLTDDYASIPIEMKSMAKLFYKDYCREIKMESILDNLKNVRTKIGDRAVLRAFHFLAENDRVELQTEALRNNNFSEFLKHTNDSGNSSFKLLQNIYSPKDVKDQGLSMALALTEMFIHQNGKGVCRVHGGGFAGAIQVFLPENQVEQYRSFIEAVLKESKVLVLSIRSVGTICLNNS